MSHGLSTSTISYPTCAYGIIVEYYLLLCSVALACIAGIKRGGGRGGGREFGQKTEDQGRFFSFPPPLPPPLYTPVTQAMLPMALIPEMLGVVP